jgi:hypothetical protein
VRKQGVTFNPPAAITVELSPSAAAGHHDRKCPVGPKLVACAASAEWPGLYHGVAGIEIGPIGTRREPPVLSIEFPAAAGPIERLYVLCVYDAKAAQSPFRGVATPGHRPKPLT